MALNYNHAMIAVVAGVTLWETYKLVKRVNTELASYRARTADDFVNEFVAGVAEPETDKEPVAAAAPKTASNSRAGVTELRAESVTGSFSIGDDVVEDLQPRRKSGAMLDGIPLGEVMERYNAENGGCVKLHIPLQPGIRSAFVVNSVAANFDSPAGIYDPVTMSGKVTLPAFIGLLVTKTDNFRAPTTTTSFQEATMRSSDGMWHQIDRSGRHGITVTYKGHVMALFQTAANSTRFDWYVGGKPFFETVDNPPEMLVEFFKLYNKENEKGWVNNKSETVEHFIKVVIPAFEQFVVQQGWVKPK